MRLRTMLLAAGTAGALAAPATAAAAWTAPTAVGDANDANPAAQRAAGGGVIVGWLDPVMSLARRSGDGFAAPTPLMRADPFERAWWGELGDDGHGVVLTVRKHKPVQRIRAVAVSADGPASAPVTISDRSHSAAQPHLDIAPDGTAVAAWQWHDPAGWRVQAAIRRPGEQRFGTPQTISPPATPKGRSQPRPWITVAAGDGGRAVVTWQIGGDYLLPESDLHVVSAGTDGRFGAGHALGDAGGLAQVGLAVSHDGEVQVAYLDQHYSGHEAPSKLHVAQGPAGGALSAPQVLSTGGKGTSSGTQIAAAFSDDGTATVAWARPGTDYEGGGTLEVFTRPKGGTFGAAQTLGEGAQGVALAGGPGGSAAVAWMITPNGGRDAVLAALRPRAGGAFAAPQTISAAGHDALWPSIAVTPDGDAVAAWVTNDGGSGSGQPTVSTAPVG